MSTLSITTRDSFVCLQASAESIDKQIKSLQEQITSLQTMKKTVQTTLTGIETSIQHISSELDQYKISVATDTTAHASNNVSLTSFLVKGFAATTSSLMKIIPTHAEDETIKQLRELLKNKMRDLAHYRSLAAEIVKCLEEISTTRQHLIATLERIAPMLDALKDISQTCDGLGLKEELLFANIVQLVERFESSQHE